ncbi:MAG: hypothetical protein NZ873_01805 [Crenarchaeota archaeon]|nr:hypothetical protein [Thermoproteota archaeon]MDW8034236.1 hypothetical protein [Nitrososphaerota archaeon]
MAEKTLEETDKFLKILVKESTLTPRQLEAIVFYYNNIDSNIVKNGYVEFKGNRVSKGAFFRTLNQAKTNIRKAIITLLIMAYLGLIDTNQLEIIIQLNSIMMQLKNRGEDVPEDVLNAFLERVKTAIDLRKRVK